MHIPILPPVLPDAFARIIRTDLRSPAPAQTSPSLKTTAQLRGDPFIVDGQKVWTELAQHGDWSFCLVRTSPAAGKQEGIGVLLIDLRSLGIRVRPIKLMGGNADANGVFFDYVEVPAENLVHEPYRGWRVARYLLGHERLNTGRVGLAWSYWPLLKERARPGQRA